MIEKRPDIQPSIIADHPIIKELTDFYVNEWKRSHPRDKKPKTSFYVSDADACPRKLFYDFKSPEEKRDLKPRTILGFRMGDLFHEELQRAIKAIGRTTANDIEFGTFGGFPFETRGRLDVFIIEDNKLVVVDIKSKNPFSHEEKPSDAEQDQILSYILQCKLDKHLIEKRGYQIADYGYLLYVDRGGTSDDQFKMWRIDHHPDFQRWLSDWYESVHKAILAGQVPQRPYERESIKCSYCRYKDFCWEGIPLPAPPALEPDGTEAPEMELVESMAENFVKLQDEAKRIDAELERAHDTLMKYFKSTGTEAIGVNGAEIVHVFRKDTELDRDYLLSKLGDKWQAIAAPQDKLIKQAIKDGLVDPEIYERSRIVRYIDQIKVKRAKGGNK